VARKFPFAAVSVSMDRRSVDTAEQIAPTYQ
jgi:hypothetical protein